jgi:hypothetical protein
MGDNVLMSENKKLAYDQEKLRNLSFWGGLVVRGAKDANLYEYQLRQGAGKSDGPERNR